MDIGLTYVEPKFFETMGISLRLGRDFRQQDDEGAPKVVIINERVASRFFGNQNPIGKRIGLGRLSGRPGLEIIGVAKDARYFDLRQQPPLMAYLPFRQFRLGGARTSAERTLLVRTMGDPKNLTATVRREVQTLDKDLPAYNVTTFSDQISESLIQERLIATLSSIFGLVGLLLASMGLYGTVAYAVVRRTNEIGIRMALGARQCDVLWMIMQETLRQAIAGVAFGLPATLATTRLITSMLFGLTPTDLQTILSAMSLLMAVVVCAGYLPARRASRVDPMSALRDE